MSVVSTDVFLLLLDVQHVLWRFFTSEFKKTGWVSTKSCMLLGKFTVPFKLLLLDNDKILISRQSRRLEEKKCLESVYYIAWQQYWTAFFFFLITLYLSRESPIYGHSLHLSHSLLTCLHDLGEPQWRHERGRTDTGGHVTWASPANRWANSTADRLLLQLQPTLCLHPTASLWHRGRGWRLLIFLQRALHEDKQHFPARKPRSWRVSTIWVGL